MSFVEIKGSIPNESVSTALSLIAEDVIIIDEVFNIVERQFPECLVGIESITITGVQSRKIIVCAGVQGQKEIILERIEAQSLLTQSIMQIGRLQNRSMHLLHDEYRYHPDVEEEVRFIGLSSICIRLSNLSNRRRGYTLPSEINPQLFYSQ